MNFVDIHEIRAVTDYGLRFRDVINAFFGIIRRSLYESFAALRGSRQVVLDVTSTKQ